MRALFAAALAAVSSPAAFAELWVPAEDEDVVSRAEAIVVGHLDAGSIRYVPHAASGDEGRSWEHHATLVVAETLKGDLAPGRTEIVIHYGLDLLVDGRFERDGHFVDVTSLRDARPAGIVELFPSLHDDVGGGPLLGRDLREDHVWFVRRAPEDHLRGKASRDRLGVLDVQDVQPLALRDYISAYLTQDPEPAVRAWLRAHPGEPAGALRFLEHCEIRRILREPDASRRVERLLPYFRLGRLWGHRDEVREGIEGCGVSAGPYLVALLRSLEFEDRQRRWVVLEMLGRLRYAPAYEAIAALVASHDATFAIWMRRPWWSDSARREHASRDLGAELCSGILALGRLGDRRGSALIRQVRERWTDQDGWGRSIRESCRDALRALEPEPPEPR
jgi:hypothetical protein